MPLSWENFGAAGNTTVVAETIPVHVEPDSPALIRYNDLHRIVQFDELSHSYTPESGILIWLIYSPVCIKINMIIYKPYAIYAAWCSIPQHKMCRSNNCSNWYNMHLIHLFDHPDEPVNTIGPTMKIFELCWNHHRVFLGLRTYYPLLGLFAPLRKRQYCFAGWQVLLKWEDLIWRSPAEVLFRKTRNSSLKGVIEVILFTLNILDPDVMSFRHDPLVGIGIFYLAIKTKTLNRSRVVKWLTLVQQPILELNKDTAKVYILIISEHKSTNFGSPVLFNLSAESLSKVGNSEIFWCISEWSQFDSSAHSSDMRFSQMINLLWYRVDKGLIMNCLET